MKKKILLIVAMVLLVASAAMAENIRPITIPSGGTLQPLQDVFTGIGSTIDVYNDQSSAAYFVPTGAGSSSAAYIATVTWGWAGLEFGLYQEGNASNQLTVIQSNMNLGTKVTIDFNFQTNTITSYYLNSGVPTLIDTAVFNPLLPFGFYTTGQYGTWYSEDSVNSTSAAQMLIYEGKGDNVTLPYGAPANQQFTLNDLAHWYVACEGAPNNGNYPFSEGNIDFNDMMVQLESIKPVPVPGALLLLGAGLFRLAAYGRRRRSEVVG
jgi:hypothetical protein